MTYNVPMFGDVSKITFFETNLLIKIISFYVQDQPRLQIRIRGPMHRLKNYD